MENTAQSIDIIGLVKASGPYLVAVAGMLFSFIQTQRVAEITKENKGAMTMQTNLTRSQNSWKNHPKSIRN